MPTAASDGPIFASGAARPEMIVSTTWPSFSTTSIVRANPTSSAVIVSSAAPWPNSIAASSADSRDTTAITTHRARNSALISTRYHS